MTNDVRIAVLDSYDKVLAFLDNGAPEGLHYYDDELHEYLKGSAYTYKFTAPAGHEDSQYLVEGNKLSFRYRSRDYYLNIMRVVKNEYQIQVEAYGLLFELLNEEKEAYAAPQAMSFAEYMAVIDYEQVITIGNNEVSDKKITHEWTGTETMLGRIYSLATVFSAEVEFVAVLRKDYSLEKIVMNVYQEHSDTVQGIGIRREDITLRYGVDVTGITKTADISDMYTAIRPTGRDGLTIASLDKTEYDADGQIEYRSPSGNRNILAVQARDRYPSNLLAASTERYIAKVWSYDTDNVDMLYGQALAELKKVCVPQVSYDVAGYFDTNIGDTVRIEDSAYQPTLYLEARVSEQIRSFTDPSRNETVFSNFREQQSQLDPDLVARVQALVDANKVYTCSILTDNGIIFKNGAGSTTLTASVMDAGADKTDGMTITWKKDGSTVGIGKTITVNASDISGKAVYRFEAVDAAGILRGVCEATVSNVVDGKDGTDGKDGSPGVGIESFTHYYLATSASSGVTTETSGWTAAPQNMTEEKRYLWNYDVTHLSDGSDETSEPCIIGIYGQTGPAGTGINSITEYYAVSASNTTAPTSWVESPVPDLTPQNKYLWNYEHFVYTDGSTYDTEKRVIGVYGDTGEKGDKGDPGTGIQEIVNYYLATSVSSGVTTSTPGWTTAPQDPTPEKKYLWNYEVFTYTDETPDTSTAPHIVGVYGQTGPAGTSIDSITDYYAVSASNTAQPTEWVTAPVPQMTPKLKYLWSYEHTVYSDGSTYDTQKRVIGAYGDTGEAGRGVSGSETTYQASDSGTVVPTGEWTANIPDVPAGKYLWTRTVTTYTDGTSSTAYSVTRQPEDGKDGTDGQDGQMLYAVSNTFQNAAAKTATLQSGTIDLSTNPTVAVRFTYDNAAVNPTLNINGTGAYPIYLHGIQGTPIWGAGSVVIFTFSNNRWYICSEPVYMLYAVVGNPAGNNMYLGESALQLRFRQVVLSEFAQDHARIGQEDGRNVYVDSEGVNIKDGDQILASFGEKTIIGNPDNAHTEIDDNGLDIAVPYAISGGAGVLFDRLHISPGGLSIKTGDQTSDDYLQYILFNTVTQKTDIPGLQKSGFDVLSKRDIQCGVSGNYSANGQSNVSISVTFPTAFASGITPVVVVTPMPAVSGQQASFEVSVKSVSRTGFQAVLTNRGSSTYTVKLAWMAMAPDD